MALAASALSLALARQFVAVPYGETHQVCATGAVISCDGKVPHSGGRHSLQLSHWTGNDTPDDLYGDTSTECAINMQTARRDGKYTEYDDAIVLNNHFDTDGVLSVWTCLQPDRALSFSELLTAGAEAGDFGEWSSDVGVKLDCAIEAIGESAESDLQAYEDAFAKLPWLLEDLLLNNGAESEQLWRAGWNEVVESWAAVQRGEAQISLSEGLAIVQQASCLHLKPAAVHRGISALDQDVPCVRVLRVTPDRDDCWKYEYEKPGHGWVQRLVSRTPVPSVDGADLARSLTTSLAGTQWELGGSGGLVAICKAEKVAQSLDEVISAILEHDHF